MENVVNFIELRLKTVNELLKETHEYIRWQAPADIEDMSREDIFKVSCEAMRVTVRITQIIGWLMLQKAILDGEFSREEIFAEKPHILQGKSCLESLSENDSQIPPRLRDLLKKSRQLYLQTKALEDLSFKKLPLPGEIKKQRIKGCDAVFSLSSPKDRKEL